MSFAGGTLSWGAVAGAQQYIVKWRLAGTIGWPHKAEAGTHRYDIPGLQGGQTYEAIVRARAARRQYGESAWSGKFRFTVSAPTAMPLPPTLTPLPPTRLPPTLTPPPPTRLPLTLTLTPPPPTATPTPVILASPASLSFAGGTLSWGAVAGAQQYIVKWRLAGTIGWPHKAEASTHRYDIPGLQGGQTYEAIVRARAARRRYVESAWSGKFRFTVSAPTAMPLPPTLTPLPPTATPTPRPPTAMPLPPTPTPLAPLRNIQVSDTGLVTWTGGPAQTGLAYRLHPPAGRANWQRTRRLAGVSSPFQIPGFEQGVSSIKLRLERANGWRRAWDVTRLGSTLRSLTPTPTPTPLPPTATPLPPTPTPTATPLTRLPSPTIISLTFGYRSISYFNLHISFRPVPNAIGYEIHVDESDYRPGREHSIILRVPADVTHKLAGEHALHLRGIGSPLGLYYEVYNIGKVFKSTRTYVKIKALGDGVNYADSEFSPLVSIGSKKSPTPRPPTATPLPPTPTPPPPTATPLPRLLSPTIISLTRGPRIPTVDERLLSITFRHVSNAIGYEIHVDETDYRPGRVGSITLRFPADVGTRWGVARKLYPLGLADSLGAYYTVFNIGKVFKNTTTYVKIKALGDGVNYTDSEFSSINRRGID